MPATRQRPIITSEAMPEATAKLIEQIAWLMDSAVKIPGTKITVGLDALLGLVPGLGDAVTGLVQSGVVMLGLYHYKIPRPIAARMAANVLLDIGLGAIPFVGDVFDIFFKANTRNLRLLNEARAIQQRGETVPTAGSVWYLVGLVVMLILALGFVIALFVVMLLAAIKWASGRPLV